MRLCLNWNEMKWKKQRLLNENGSLKEDKKAGDKESKEPKQALLLLEAKEEAKEEKEEKGNKIKFESYGNEMFYKLLRSAKLVHYWP